jgi:hypothetical protein
MLDMTARYLAVIPYPLSSPVPTGPHHVHQGPIEIIPPPATIQTRLGGGRVCGWIQGLFRDPCLTYK